MDTWTFFSETGEESISISGPLAINDPSALVAAAVEHAGVLLIDEGLLGDTMHQGKLVPILPSYQPIRGLPMYVVFPERELMSAKIRALVHFLLAEIPPIIQSKAKHSTVTNLRTMKT